MVNLKNKIEKLASTGKPNDGLIADLLKGFTNRDTVEFEENTIFVFDYALFVIVIVDFKTLFKIRNFKDAFSLWDIYGERPLVLVDVAHDANCDCDICNPEEVMVDVMLDEAIELIKKNEEKSKDYLTRIK